MYSKHFATHFLSSDNEEEEEEDDDGPRHMPFFRDFLNHMSEMASRRANRRPVETLSKKIRPDDDDDDEESDEDNYCSGETGTRCAACFRSDNPSHKWRRLGEKCECILGPSC